MDASKRSAGVGLIAYGIGTAVAFMSSGSPGGDYSDRMVADYVAPGHAVPAFLLAYLGAFAAVGLLVFARWARTLLPSRGELFWALAVAAATAGVIGWFLVGGVAVAFAEGGGLAAVPHQTVYLITEISNLVAVCASSFLAGIAAIVLAATAPLPAWLRVATGIAGVCGILGPTFFPIFLFWIWTLVAGAWALATTRTSVVAPARAMA
ncbi:MAG: hypothetical protein QOC59_1987 [Microbacteriaceae bacterium]|nr:hypothetical protein [Microbacteriaceae bacterium]